MSEQTKTFMFILRGGGSMKEMSSAECMQVIRRYQAWIESLRQGGHYNAGSPLEEDRKVVSGADGAIVSDGPFIETKESVGGYFLINAKDLDQAVELARGCPIFDRDGTVEVRPLQAVVQSGENAG
ncbi:MAG: hypothetical protein QOH96_927 [Blastocatellia bacterium]|nr:hypothetical protein [Blastocatellia bacterium]